MIDTAVLHTRIADRAIDFLTDLFGAHELKRAGQEQWRVGRKGSLAIGIRDGALMFFSHEEGAGGDAIALWQRIRGGTAGEALQACANWASVSDDGPRASHGAPHRPAARAGAEPAKPPPEYLAGDQLATAEAMAERLAEDPARCETYAGWRGWKTSTVQALALEGTLGYSEAWAGHHDGALAFIYPSGIKHRWKKDGERVVRWHSGKPATLWRGSLITGATKTVYMTEGETDAISLLDADIEDTDSVSVVALPNAGVVPWGLADQLANRVVVLCLDNDEAGQRATEKITETILSSVRGLQVWKGAPGTDISDLHKSSGVAGLRSALERQCDVVKAEPPPLVPLMDIAGELGDPLKTVLGKRYLCKKSGLLYVGPSGIGKSSSSVQQDVLWGLGREAFGIQPARPLRVLTIQAENDDEDIAEMRDGVCNGLRLSPAERAMVRHHVFYEAQCGLTGAAFLAYVDKRLSLGKFDILRIDPLLAYLGGDPQKIEVTQPFLRDGLNPLLAKHDVACIVNHHTPKTTNRDTSAWRGSDWMYAGGGNADISNWARAILVIDPTQVRHVFRFHAAKRESRIGWVNDDGEREYTRLFCHASDGIYWRSANEDDEAALEDAKAGGSSASKAGRKSSYSKDQLLKEMSILDGIRPAELKAVVQESTGMPKSTFYELLGELRKTGLVIEKGCANERQLFLAGGKR